MTNTLIKTTLMVAVSATAAMTLLSPTGAEARDREIYQQTYTFDNAMHGYEGRAPVGNKYCTYKRFPIRKCWNLANGAEQCKIVKWELEQTCY